MSDAMNTLSPWEGLGAVGWIWILGAVISLNLVEAWAFCVTAVCMYFGWPNVMVAEKYS